MFRDENSVIRLEMGETDEKAAFEAVAGRSTEEVLEAATYAARQGCKQVNCCLYTSGVAVNSVKPPFEADRYEISVEYDTRGRNGEACGSNADELIDNLEVIFGKASELYEQGAEAAAPILAEAGKKAGQLVQNAQVEAGNIRVDAAAQASDIQTALYRDIDQFLPPEVGLTEPSVET
jgi:hypothetical protein